jgi:hypothetical protein
MLTALQCSRPAIASSSPSICARRQRGRVSSPPMMSIPVS